jgi:hypothetical protein
MMANFLESYIFEASKLEGESKHNVWKFKIFHIHAKKSMGHCGASSYTSLFFNNVQRFNV